MIDFLTSRLPQAVLSKIDLESLRLTNKNFVSKAGKQTHSDLIYAARLDNQLGYIYLVTEHFSEEEEYAPLRHLEYNLPLWRQHLQEWYKKLPLMLNISLYNALKPYKGPRTLLAMFDYPALAQQYMLEGYYIVDLRTDSVERILEDKQAGLVGLLLKQGKLRDFYNWLDVHEIIINQSDASYLEEAFVYILAVDPKEEMLEKLKQNTDPLKRR